MHRCVYTPAVHYIVAIDTRFSFHRPKHPTKVNVWAGISKRGATGVCIFEGIMKNELYTEILQKTLLPFAQARYPNGYKFMQDNDPKHVAGHTLQWMDDNDVPWWKTPAESPDINPIENLWHELKEYIHREVKPRVKEELVQGIVAFWQTVDVQKCAKYIKHLRKVIPRVIELNGEATGY